MNWLLITSFCLLIGSTANCTTMKKQHSNISIEDFTAFESCPSKQIVTNNSIESLNNSTIVSQESERVLPEASVHIDNPPYNEHNISDNNRPSRRSHCLVATLMCVQGTVSCVLCVAVGGWLALVIWALALRGSSVS